MVIVKLMGGLGNQMFQYAAGRALAEKHQVDISLDVTFLNDRSAKENFTYRNYELNCFNVTTAFAKENDLAKYKVGRLGRIIRKIIKNDCPVHFYE
ncbi:MAG: hypothetical protein WBJ10_09755 [Daejeonella sp.]|uniref:hypothetical protein n=1 Tax=Daejeonella sp. TaxID=2805397 RepID=UPI003C761D5E